MKKALFILSLIPLLAIPSVGDAIQASGTASTTASPQGSQNRVMPTDQTYEGSTDTLFYGEINQTSPDINDASLWTKTISVCNSLRSIKNGVWRFGSTPSSSQETYQRIQDAVDEAENSLQPTIVIEICSGTYDQDIEIRTTKNLRFVGQGTVVITGSGDENNIVEIWNACSGDTEWCYGTTSFENIQFRKTTGVTENPSRAILSDYAGFCTLECTRLDRAVIHVSESTFEGFVTAINVRGKTTVDLEDVEFFNQTIEEERSLDPVIKLSRGGEVAVESGYGTETAEDYENGVTPILNASDVEFHDNEGYFVSLIYAETASITLDSVSAHDNTGSAYLIFIEDASHLEITNSEFVDNDYTAIYVDSLSSMTMDNTVISNQASSWNGGAILASGDLTISNSTISDNSTTRDGGGLYYSGSQLTSTNTCWSGNSPDDVYHDTGGSYNFGCSDFTCDEDGCS